MSFVVFVRHGEREAVGADPALTAAGRERARRLARMLRDAGVSAIFTSEARRTKETAQPLAAALHLGPKVIADDLDAARAELLASGGCVLVIGHTDTVPALVAKLGGPADLSIADDEFDRFLVLTLAPGQPAALLPLRY